MFGPIARRERSGEPTRLPGWRLISLKDQWDRFAADVPAGDLAYGPGLIRAPVAIIRGEWDSLCTDADAGWLFDAMRSSPVRRDVKIGRATHLLHLEQNRRALYREAEAFLRGDDQA